jgi:prolyl-tRNA editing enzyme YbaK/EbsC (Cys-tRNA(Pro) deacylase)
VAAQESVLIEAGVHDRSLRLAPRDLVAHTSAVVADVCFD